MFYDIQKTDPHLAVLADRTWEFLHARRGTMQHDRLNFLIPVLEEIGVKTVGIQKHGTRWVFTTEEKTEEETILNSFLSKLKSKTIIDPDTEKDHLAGIIEDYKRKLVK